MAKRGYITPFGLNRHILLGFYAFVVWLTGYFVGGVDALRRLLVMNDTARGLTESEFDQRVAIESIANVGFGVATAASWLVARFASHHDIKRTAIASTVLFAVGLILLIMGEMLVLNYLGVMIVASTFSASFNAHVSIAPLFPDRSELVFDVLGSVPDASCLLPLMWIYASEHVEAVNPVQVVVQAYAVGLCFIALLQILFIPTTPYSDLISNKYRRQMENTPKRPHKFTGPIARLPGLRRLTALLSREEEEDVVLGDLTVVQQVMHPLFLMGAIFFTVNLFRKYHLMSTFRFTVLRYAELEGTSPEYAETVIEALNIAAGLSWIPTAFLTRLTNQTGALTNTALTCFLMLISSVCYAIPSVQLQWVTVLTFGLWSSYIFSNLFAVLTEYFGIKYVANLQGLQMLIGGLATLAHPSIMDLIGQPYIEGTTVSTEMGGENSIFFGLPLYHAIHVIIAAFSLLLVMIPIFEAKMTLPHYYRLRKQRDAKRIESEAAMNQQVAQVTAEATGIDPAQLNQMQLGQLLHMFTTGQHPPNTTEEDMARVIMAQLGTMGVDVNEILDQIRPTSAEEEPQGVRRLSLRTDGSSRRGSDSRLLPGHRRRSSLNKIQNFGTGTAFLDERSIAELAGQVLAEEASKRYPRRSSRHDGSDADSNYSDEVVVVRQQGSEGTEDGLSDEEREQQPLLQGTSAGQYDANEDTEHKIPITLNSTYGRPAERVSTIALPLPEGLGGVTLLHHDSDQ